MSEHDITDETLVAYLDGALSDTEHARVDAALAADALLGERLAGLDLDTDALRDGFAHMLATAPAIAIPEPDASPRPQLAANKNRSPLQAVAAAALLAIGIGLGWGLGSDNNSAPGWHKAVADYQVLYTTDTLAAVPVSAEARAQGLATVNRHLGMDLTEEQLALDGMALQRAQILSFEGAPLAQVAFLDNAGIPIALCIMQGDSSEARAQIEIAGLNAATWSGGGYSYILIGPTDAGKLDTAASVLQSRLDL